MEDLSASILSLILLLLLSGCFSLAEVALMAANRYRLRQLTREGRKGAVLAQRLLDNVEHLQATVLVVKTLAHAAAAVLTAQVALHLLGADTWASAAGILFISFCLLVFSEILPKTLGAAYPDQLLTVLGFMLTPLQRLLSPVVRLINFSRQRLYGLLRPDTGKASAAARITPEDLRAVVREAGHFMPQQHQDMLLKFFDLENIRVDDIMKPRGEIEAIDMAAPIEDIHQQLATSFHTRLLIYENEPNNVLGILHQRRLLAASLRGELDHQTLRSHLSEPYFIPAGTSLYAQLQFFQKNLKRIGLVVDEYGELLGLIALEDIIEEIVGKFANRQSGVTALAWQRTGTGQEEVLVDGARTLRELNRVLGLNFSLHGPKTLNGLIVEHLQDIPEAGLSLRVDGITLEIVQTQDRRIRMVRLFRPITATA